MSGETLRRDVLAWVDYEKNHPKRCTPSWRIELANRLATFEDMTPAWNELTKYGADGVKVIHLIFQAVEAAQEECHRLPATEEQGRIDAVVRSLDNLREAIARAPFLDSAGFIDLDGKPVAFSWRASGAKEAEEFRPMIQTVCLDDLLEVAKSEILNIDLSKPKRTVARRGGNLEVASFVRHLAAHFERDYGKQMMGTIAYIASAVYDLPNSKDKVDIARILRSKGSQ